jgi:Lipocalin-like domain
MPRLTEVDIWRVFRKLEHIVLRSSWGASMTISLCELLGWWKLSTVAHEFPDRPTKFPFGRSARGSLVFTSDQRLMLAILGSEVTANGVGFEAEVHSGRFALEGPEIITISEYSSRLEWINNELRYSASLARGVLFLTSRQVGLLYGGAPFAAASSWVRQPES